MPAAASPSPLTTADVARLLGVKPATVYAYVSRGLLGSRRNADGKNSLFDRREVDAFLASRRRPTTPGIRTGITLISDGSLRYRGHDAVALARVASFEEVVALLWTGTRRYETFAPDPRLRRLAEAVTAPLPRTARHTDRLRVIVAAAAAGDPLRFDTSPAAVTATARSLLATMVAALPAATGPAARRRQKDALRRTHMDSHPLGDPDSTVLDVPGTARRRDSERNSWSDRADGGQDDLNARGDGADSRWGGADSRWGGADSRWGGAESGRGEADGARDGADGADGGQGEADGARDGADGGWHRADGARDGADGADCGWGKVGGADGGRHGADGDVGGPRLAEVLWERLTAREATPREHNLLEAALILLADHDIAASTLAARVAASTRAHPYAVVGAGLAALDGPLHGAASSLAHHLLADVLDKSDPVDAVADRLRAGEPVPGFGHRLYPDGDPRARALLDMLGDTRAGDAAGRLAEVVGARSGVRPNVDLALAALTLEYQMPPDAGETIFAVARTAGWIAHALEEYADRPSRFRPSGEYAGEAPRSRG
ncbi:citrate synthase [Paractinoplanes abujensis]|uniref:citrate synthase (unknown stereospecificity) n=1 Tax=Paractinoplanes abujensis TaxID=882441 RepID=A0A7W7CS00_9ACTN|nr:citrate synthase [Actinoplanes abujensis]MBB4691896.1 excisionase family DNA binding protein [Actinoplanes abujensis]